jgi:hypothetical protein
MRSDDTPERPEQRIVVNTNEARQAEAGHNVRYVLGVGLASAVVVLALVYLLYFKA